jgi:hypothetical protein
MMMQYSMARVQHTLPALTNTTAAPDMEAKIVLDR